MTYSVFAKCDYRFLLDVIIAIIFRMSDNCDYCDYRDYYLDITDRDNHGHF
jgi:hypothetical protein